LLHYLLGIRTELDLQTHPKSGASWEGYVVEEVIKAVEPDEAYYWATHNGSELDLLLLKDGKRLGVECKRVDAPRLTSSMQIALQDLELDRLFVVYPGTLAYPLADKATALPLSAIATAETANLINLL
jgi:predicted AAA+ superfamily ATPase